MDAHQVSQQKIRGCSLLAVLILIAALLAAGCSSSTAVTSSPPQVSPLPAQAISSSPVEHIEVYHFHGNHQCAPCIAVGDLAEQTVKTNFKEEFASGRLVFAHVNAELPENYALASKYGVTGSSLWIGVYNADGFHKEQDIRVWSLVNDKDQYMTYLSGIITRRLNGDFA
jgi:thiol-disulfide isomerase/thioredoxin